MQLPFGETTITDKSHIALVQSFIKISLEVAYLINALTKAHLIYNMEF